VAFALGFGHGDHGEYHLAGSMRAPDLKIPLAYPLLWDLVIWARRMGSTWFDFGGVTPARLGDDDELGGISDFKRYFSTTCVVVGEEWVLEPRRARAELANVVSAGAAWLTSRQVRA
jgi:lipid II:glycine glycyltransferase (peptidoglycan interpeptide bridge formation enzyme)